MRIVKHPDGRIEIEGLDAASALAVLAALDGKASAPETPPAPAPVAAVPAPKAAPPVRPGPPTQSFHLPPLPPPGPPSLGPVERKAPLLQVPTLRRCNEFIVAELRRAPATSARVREAARAKGMLVRESDIEAMLRDPESGITKDRGGTLRYDAQPRTVAFVPTLVQEWKRGSTR